jgi:hypothetical protein
MQRFPLDVEDRGKRQQQRRRHGRLAILDAGDDRLREAQTRTERALTEALGLAGALDEAPLLRSRRAFG